MVIKEVADSSTTVRKASVFTNMLETEAIDLVFDCFGADGAFENDGQTRKTRANGEAVDYLVVKFKDFDEHLSLRWQCDIWKTVVEEEKGVKRDIFVRPTGTFNDVLRELYDQIPNGMKVGEAVKKLNELAKESKLEGTKVRVSVKRVVRVTDYKDANNVKVRSEDSKQIKNIDIVSED